MIRSIGLSETETLVWDTIAARLAEQSDTPDDPARHYYRALSELGVLAVPLAQDLGGLGEGLGNAALVLVPLGQEALVTPFIETVCVPAAVAEWLPGFAPLQAALASAAMGGAGAVMAWMEHGRGWSRNPELTVARRNGAGWSLRGRKNLVRWADRADAFIVTARFDDDVALFWVPADSGGITAAHYRSADGRSLTDLEFHDVVLPDESLLSIAGSAATIDYALDAGAAVSLAEAVGLMNRSLDMTIDYLKTRQQFGVALSAMQAIQHRLVEMYADVECAWSLARDAASCLSKDTLPAQRQATISGAKVYVGRAGRRVAQEALQMHGAIGMTRDYPLGRYLQRLTAIDLDYGDGDWHLRRLQSAMQGENH